MPDPALKSGFRWFLIGFGLLGLCVGYFAGNSNSPVIGVVLPLLFGLVGGAGGFYLSGADLSAPGTALRLRLLGVSLTVFILLLLVGSVYGVLLRTRLGIASFFPKSLFASEPSHDLPALEEKSAHEAIQMVLMRGRLRALGASESEQQIILDRIVKDQATFEGPRNPVRTLNRLALLIDRTVTSLPAKVDGKAPREIDDLRLYLSVYSKDLTRYAGKAEAGEKMPLALFSVIVETVKNELEKRMDRPGNEMLIFLSQHEPVRQQLADLRWALYEEANSLRGNPSLGRPQVIQEADQFLGLISGGTKSGESSLIEKPKLGPQFAP
jgi:hypothetical protein